MALLSGRGHAADGVGAMRWQMGRRSENIEDRRGMAPSGMGRGVRVGGIGGLGIVALALVAMFLGVDPSIILSRLPATRARAGRGPHRQPPGNDESAQFVWWCWPDRGHLDRHLRQAGSATRAAPGAVRRPGRSACGLAGAAAGPSSARPTGRSISTSRSSTTRPEVRCARRLRPGLCGCARGRPSRADPARHLAPGDRAPPAIREATPTGCR